MVIPTLWCLIARASISHVTAFCLFCINLVALADETSLPSNWEDYGKLATFANGERNNNEDIVLSTVEGRPTYTIYTARGLAWVAYVTNNGRTGEGYPASTGFEGCTVELGNDLCLARPTGFPDGFASWTPIGTSSNPFLGTFDGKYKAISGLTVTGVAAGEVISIYNASGHLLHRNVANGEPIEIPMTAGQVYIVKIGNQIIKLM